VPEFPKTWQVTVRQLLDHSACLQDSLSLTDGWIVKPGEEFPPLEEVFRQYVQDFPELACEPGLVSQYSNPHYLALARIIEAVSGEPYDTYVVDHLLAPLKMDSTRFRVVEPEARYARGQWPADKTEELIAMLDEYRGESNQDVMLGEAGGYVSMDNFRILPPWGGLFGTPGDITHFLQMHMDGGSYDGVQILKPETVAAMQQMQRSTTGSPLGFGLSWILGKDEFGMFYEHSGGGHTIETVMIVYPDLDLGVVVMSNFNGSQAEKIARALMTVWRLEK
jgi:CubicO group peptidase (beta-lactamase class C family)